jgi:hypothetical protein
MSVSVANFLYDEQLPTLQGRTYEYHVKLLCMRERELCFLTKLRTAKMKEIYDTIRYDISYYIWYDIYVYDIWYDIFNRNWVDIRWQQYSTHLHTNNTQNSENGTYITIKKLNIHNNRKVTNLYMKYKGNYSDSGGQKYSEKNPSPCYFDCHVSHTDWLGIEHASLQWEVGD